jgi:hypothetical protein
MIMISLGYLRNRWCILAASCLFFFCLGIRVFAQMAETKEGVSEPPILAPPRDVRAVDTPRDGGLSITVQWEPPSGDVSGILGYRIYRSESLSRGFELVGEVDGGAGEFRNAANDRVAVVMGREYYYRVAVFDSLQESVSEVVGPVKSRPTWFDTHRLPVFLAIVIFFGSVLLFFRITRRGKGLFIREIAGIAAMDEAVGRATELGRPILYIPGIMDVDNIQTIASMAILIDVARLAAQYDVPIVVPLNRAFVVPMAEESVRQGFLTAGRPDAYNRDNVRYLSDEQFAFTAGVNGIMIREKTAAHFFLGAFFAESLILSEMGFSTGAIQIAGTANIHQLPFFVVACDYTLIGEEFYAASAYISRDPKLLGPLKGADVMKILIMAILVVGALLELFGVHFLTELLTLG